ncbi:MAG: polyisoprenoid-binding protein [Alphaproteobacteria bacterium]|nr:polyisoprenoid-binding protein [Alphaproteobacteria bacterium]
MKKLLATIALVLMATPALAGNWTVDHAKSKLGFTILWDGHPFTAVFGDWTADITFSPDDLAHASADVTIKTGSMDSGDPDTDDSVKGAYGFAVDAFPTARFKATNFSRKGKGYEASGTLTIRGISKPIALPFLLTISGDMAHVTGMAKLLRTDYSVGTGEWAADKPAAREVRVTLDIIATRAGKSR